MKASNNRFQGTLHKVSGPLNRDVRSQKMKARIRETDGEEIARLYPITGKLDGWFFRSKETSPYSYTVEGTDKWGRRVSRMGSDPAALLTQCVEDAKSIQKQLKTEPSA